MYLFTHLHIINNFRIITDDDNSIAYGDTYNNPKQSNAYYDTWCNKKSLMLE